MQSVSLRDFEKFSSDAYVQAALQRAKFRIGGAYQDFIRQLYIDLDAAIHSMQAGCELRQIDSEDRLSGEIICGLRQFGYTATADTKSGGHVDISIQIGKHSWIGEAKKDGAFDEGLLQLIDRYKPLSGNYSHNQGGLIFYLVKTKDAKGVLDRFRDKLVSNALVCSYCKSNPLAFYSEHTLIAAGTKFRVRTMCVALHFAPTDKSARRSATTTGTRSSRDRKIYRATKS